MNMAVIENTEFAEVEGAKFDYVADWLKYQADKAASTVATYTKAIKQWLKFLRDEKIDNPNRESVTAYRNHLLKETSPNTGRLYLTAVKMFVKWLASIGACVDYASGVNGISLDTSMHERQALTESQARSLLNSMSGSNEKSLRDKAIVALMLNCALRSIEITRLDKNDIEVRHGKHYLKVHGKGRSGKVDRVLMPPQVFKLIKAYLEKRGNDQNAPLFTSTSRSCKGARLQTQSISRMVKAALKAIGLDSPSLTCHSLRHTAATIMLLEGVPDACVQQILRHKSIVTTQIYRHDIDFERNTGTLYAARKLFEGEK